MLLKKISKLSSFMAVFLAFTILFNPLAQAFTANSFRFAFSKPTLSLRVNNSTFNYQYGNTFSLRYYRYYNNYSGYVDQYVISHTPEGNEK